MTADPKTNDPVQPPMKLRVLYVEDNPRDVKLTAIMLERAGYAVTGDAVDTIEKFRERLTENNYEVIICDYNLRNWTAMDALEIFREIGKDIPFIIVSGSLGDEAATECLKRGATDYVLKDRVARLPSAINLALQSKASRQERKRAEQALKESEERYRLLFETNPHPMWIYDTETLAFQAVNNTAVAHYGYSREEFLRMKILDIRPPENASDLPEEIAKTNSPVQEGGVRRHRKKDGTIIHVQIASQPLPFGSGKARFVQVEDVTERKKLEEQFRQAQKMEAIGRLAGGIAHDFNNLLTVINGYGQLVVDGLAQQDELHEHVEQIIKAGERAASLTRQLLAFSRQQVLLPQNLDLNALVASADKMLRRLIGEDIDILTVQRAGLGQVKADPSQIEQVIMNLVVNARDAMPTGGKIIIETDNVVLDETYARSHASVKPGHYVMLAVSDTGTGMDAATQARIFEPFFTTKPKGKGTGLGLATVIGIVKQSGGDIWVYSELHQGTTFKVYLPRVKNADLSALAGTGIGKKAEGNETVLVVEDEEALRLLVRGVLEKKGYKVLVARHGDEALGVSDQHGGEIHLLLTDVVMPQVNGRMLAARLAFTRPKIKVLYMSGYTDNAIVHHGVLEPGIAFLQKPFTPEGLAHKIREVLDSAEGAAKMSA